MTNPKPDPDSRTQAEKFADLAREVECDESEKGFDERLRRVARTPVAEGAWIVVSAKVGAGYVARFTPSAYGPTRDIGGFRTQEEAERWVAENS